MALGLRVLARIETIQIVFSHAVLAGNEPGGAAGSGRGGRGRGRGLSLGWERQDTFLAAE
jgi:hypothetical protein